MLMRVPQIMGHEPESANDILYDILGELQQLNETLTTLTKEHVIHFDEWRAKNGN